MEKHVVGSKIVLALLPVAMLAIMGLSFAPVAGASTAPKYETTFSLHCNNNAYICPGYQYTNEGNLKFFGDGSGLGHVVVHEQFPGTGQAYTVEVTSTYGWEAVAQTYGLPYFSETLILLGGTVCTHGPGATTPTCQPGLAYIDSGTPTTPGHYNTAVLQGEIDLFFGLPPNTNPGPGFSYDIQVSLVG